MPTWVNPYPPRSEWRTDREKSPSRAAYGHLDQTLPMDQRRDRELYGRDSNGAEWERDRASYDYRRPRSRSPAYEEGYYQGRKRRRSPSPYDRERYDPRPRYDDYDAHRNYGRSPPRTRGQYGHGSGGRAPPIDPNTLNYPASLKQFAEWFRYTYPEQAKEEDTADKESERNGTKTRNGIKSRWEKYKKEFLNQQLQTLFDHHRKSPWFAEKYDPSQKFIRLRNRVRKVGWRGRVNQFINDLDEGKFDVISSESEPPSSPMKEDMDTGASGDSAPIKQDDQLKNEDEFGMGMENEEAADNAGDLKSEANGRAYDNKFSGKDEVAVLPEGNQIMIRTIPPDIGRVKLEKVVKDIPGFVYLALGDPMQKRNYYRAGWIKFNEDADVPKILSTLGEIKVEGFKLHVSHNSRPFSSKIRYAPEIASRPERIVKDLEQAKKLAYILEADHERIRLYKPEPAANKDVTAEGNDENAANEDEDAVEDVLMRDALADEEEPIERGSDAVERRIAKLYSELPEATNEAEAKALEEKKNVIALDLYLAYLRNAFHTCYYCVSVSDHVEELQRKCIKHMRKPLTKPTITESVQQADTDSKANGENEEDGAEDGDSREKQDTEDPEKEVEKEREKEKEKEAVIREKEKGTDSRDWKRNDERWAEWLDNRIACLVDRDNIDVRDYGGRRYEDELSKIIQPHIKMEEEAKFRCKNCSKLFKATEFVGKHILNKHPELVEGLDDPTYFNNFALDPQRIQPFTHYPQQTGNSQAPPPQAYGLRNAPQPWEAARGAAPPMSFYGYPPAMAHMNPQGDPYAAYPGYYNPYGPPPAMVPPPQRSLREEPPLSSGGRRLGDRIGGYAPGLPQDSGGHGIGGLPPKPMGALDAGLGGRRNGRAPPPPPPNAREDPRAAAGRKVSYHDMDLVAEGDVELNY